MVPRASSWMYYSPWAPPPTRKPSPTVETEMGILGLPSCPEETAKLKEMNDELSKLEREAFLTPSEKEQQEGAGSSTSHASLRKRLPLSQEEKEQRFDPRKGRHANLNNNLLAIERANSSGLLTVDKKGQLRSYSLWGRCWRHLKSYFKPADDNDDPDTVSQTVTKTCEEAEELCNKAHAWFHKYLTQQRKALESSKDPDDYYKNCEVVLPAYVKFFKGAQEEPLHKTVEKAKKIVDNATLQGALESCKYRLLCDRNVADLQDVAPSDLINHLRIREGFIFKVNEDAPAPSLLQRIKSWTSQRKLKES